MRLARLLPALMLLSAAYAASAVHAAPRAEHLRLLVSPERRTWSLQERVGNAYRTLLRDARVRAVRADGSEVAWSAMRRAPDGHSFTLEGPDLNLKVLAQWLDPQRLPGTVTLLPIAFPKRDGVQLREVSVADGGILPTISPDVVVFNHGYQAWTRTTVQPLDTGLPVTSWWLTALHSRRHSLVAGYLSNVLGANAFTALRGPQGITLSDRSDLRRLTLPRVAGGFPLDALYLAWGKSPSDMLAEYAAGTRVFTGLMDPAPAFNPKAIPGGWCSWYAFYGNVTEEQVIANADAARRSFGPREVNLIQVDDGFEVAAGDWDTNARFPHGHRWLTNQIHARGLKAGLWIAPFAVGEKSTIVRDHPDWLLKDRDGKPIQQGTNPRWGGVVYVLDASRKPVREWLRDLFRRVTREWGYDYIKIDFLYFPMLPDGVLAGDMTPAQSYRAALKAIRLGAGKDAYILGCGAPIGPTIGLVNGNRIGPDVNRTWPQIVEAARDVAYRQWMHNVWWENDPDTLNVAEPMPLEQARAWTAAIALSGGLALLSDDLTKLSPERLALTHMAVPVAANGDAAPFGTRGRLAMRATGMRLADMWAGSRPLAPALTSSEATVSLRPGTPGAPVWLLRTGDDRDWAKPDLSEGPEWRPLAPGVRWESLPGLEKYDGYAWYRVRFRIPAGTPHSDMVLHLGRINDVDETWVNGREVGATGSFPQDYKTAWTQDRRYTVPAESLRWGLGEENVLAIRVYDGGGDGGLTDLGAAEPPAIWRLPSSVSPAQVTVAGFFNWGEGRRSVSVTPSDLGAARRGQRAHLWDVWDARYLGATTGSAPLDIAPTSCRLLSIVPDVGHPQLLGTDAHVTSGAQSVVGVKWDARHRALKGRSRVRPDVPFHLALTVPRGLGLFRLDVTGARAERLPSADGSALFRITPDRDEVVWVARYTRG